MSSMSDTYEPGKAYAGFIIYGKGREAHPPFNINGRKVYPGYVVIRDSGADDVVAMPPSEEEPQSQAFRSVFGADASQIALDVISEDFAIIFGRLRQVPSLVSLGGARSAYADAIHRASIISSRVLSKFIETWISGNVQNLSVSDMIEARDEIDIQQRNEGKSP